MLSCSHLDSAGEFVEGLQLWCFSRACHVEGKSLPRVVVCDGVAVMDMKTLELDLVNQAGQAHLHCGCLHHPVVNIHGNHVHAPEGLLALLGVDVL